MKNNKKDQFKDKPMSIKLIGFITKIEFLEKKLFINTL